MSGRFRVARSHLARLEDLGIRAEDVVRAAGLPSGWLREERLLLDTDQLFAFWRAVGEVGGDPLLGLRLGAEDCIERYDPVGLAVLSSSCFRDAIERAGRYKQLMCPEEIRLVGRGRELRLQFRFPLKRELVPAVLQDLCFAWIVAIGRRGTGHALSPLRVELSRPSVDRQAYEEYFGCPVEPGAGADSLVFDAADLDRPFETQNPELLAMIAPQLDAELAHRRQDATAADRAKVTVKRLLAGRRPDLRDVAREIGVSTRTLQRRLADAGLTFQQILEGARRELAHHYLLHSALDLTETAYVLGYEDASSFFRAFQQWEGDSPGRWRDRHRSVPAPRGAFPRPPD
ncbi:MAG: AraC family transcriptional regulator [Vicinamibacteria bacterium]